MDEQISLLLTCCDPDGDVQSYEASDLPTGVSLTDNDACQITDSQPVKQSVSSGLSPDESFTGFYPNFALNTDQCPEER